ncbi:MAG TPA: UDP-N-acetylmuramate dehydrogenase [Terriglobales bacterium]|nr:UDP-N-acetylmuramate dehydrogenase [Terriglobales bacterium]
MQIQENVALAPYTTLQVGGPARFFIETRAEDEIRDALLFARERSLQVFVLGGGSNLVVADAGWPGVVLRIAVGGTATRSKNGKQIFTAGAGEDWDSLVAFSVEQNCSGVECMSGIPGTVGGTPVQNVGAYGQEVKDTITTVRVLDTITLELRDMAAADCGFAYRTSIFNSSEKGRYIVARVSFALTPSGSPKIEYADLKRYFGDRSAPTLKDVRDAVRSIRSRKGMLISVDDPDSRSAGSFFKNPIVPPAEYERIAALPICKDQKPPSFPAPAGTVKMSAAWLVERSGFQKGYADGRVGISSKHSLAVVNRGAATASDVMRLKNKVQEGVFQTFGVRLQPEPVFVGF